MPPIALETPWCAGSKYSPISPADLPGRWITRRAPGNQIPFANHFVDRNGGELRHLIRARDKASAATRPKQLDVPNVITIGEDDFRDRLHHN